MSKKQRLFSERFLGWLVKTEYMEEIMGDLLEYKDELQEKPRWKRPLFYWFHVFNFLQPWALKQFIPTSSIFSLMLSYHFKIAFRHLRRQKLYTAINVGGLTGGLTVVILISLLIRDELTFNQYNENYSQVARIIRTQTHQGERSSGTNQPFALAQELRKSYDDYFEYVAMEVTWTGEQSLSFGDKKFVENGSYMEIAAPLILDLKMQNGSLNGLEHKGSILLSSSLAEKLFGTEDPIQKIVTLDGERQVQVTGVYEDIPKNSEFYDIHFILPFEQFYDRYSWANADSWRGSNAAVYVKTKPGISHKAASAAIENMMLPHVDEATKTERKPALFLQPMSNWYFYSNFDDPPGTMSAQLRFVLLYAAIGLSILLLACINFINLSTARFEKRVKEASIRKVIGSQRRHLISQFLGESFIIVQFTFLLSVIIAWSILPWFNQVIERATVMPLTNPWFWVIGISLATIISVLAGGYPAFYLSSFDPVKALKGAFNKKRRVFNPRKALVVFQFAISTTLITGSVLIFKQIQFAKNRDLGYQQEYLLMLNMTSKAYAGKYEILKKELIGTGMVTQVAAAGVPVTENQYQNNGFSWKGKHPDLDPIFNDFYISADFGKTIGWQVTNGRDFSQELASDASGVIINRSTAELMALENPLGEEIRWKKEDGKTFRILGVVEDLVRNSPFEYIRPSVYFLAEDQPWLHLNVSSTVDMGEAIGRIEEIFQEVVPSAPFQYKFADQEYARKFGKVESLSQLSGFFTLLAVLICCFGLFGLASFVAEQRTKEIGIRKILGASVSSIWQMLSKDFILLVLLSFLIAMPLASLLLEDWLSGFEYRISLEWWIFASAGIGALLIALITVSYQTLKIALINPVKSLRYE